uniref:Retrovirus-related Pol polyprotein from transposon TNT 1-94 n=1 Tax=Cajanus cajan TaxID=3821 RepID=A0A151UFX3_CAJCA
MHKKRDSKTSSANTHGPKSIWVPKTEIVSVADARTLLNDFSIPKHFWVEAVNTSCYIQNRIYITPLLKKTPYELSKGRAPNISYFHPFGCKCFILNTKDNLGKFDSKIDEGILLGYSERSRAYRVFNNKTKTVEEEIKVRFDEKKHDKEISELGNFFENTKIKKFTLPLIFKSNDHWQLLVICPMDNIAVCICSLHKPPPMDFRQLLDRAMEGYHILKGSKLKKKMSWVSPKSHKQKGNYECEYYVMKTMHTIVDLQIVSRWTKIFIDQSPLSLEDINTIREQWATFFIDYYIN